MNMYQFKHYIPKDNLQIAEGMSDISIAGGKIHRFWGGNLTSNPPHHSPSSRTICRTVGASGRRTKSSQQNRWSTRTWIIKMNSSLQGGGQKRTQTMLRSCLYLEWLTILHMHPGNHMINQTGSQQRDIQPTSGTSHPVFQKNQKGEWKKNQG